MQLPYPLIEGTLFFTHHFFPTKKPAPFHTTKHIINKYSATLAQKYQPLNKNANLRTKPLQKLRCWRLIEPKGDVSMKSATKNDGNKTGEKLAEDEQNEEEEMEGQSGRVRVVIEHETGISSSWVMESS